MWKCRENRNYPWADETRKGAGEIYLKVPLFLGTGDKLKG